MKFKLDENLGPAIQQVFVDAKLDCHTVRDERLSGAEDPKVLAAAIAEDRILVTMDFDFSNIVRYPPAGTSGIAVLSPPGRASRALLRSLAESLVTALTQNAIRGKLWIVEPTRIREHQPDDIDD